MAKFTKSDNFRSEYSCAIVYIGEVIPIEGSDFLAKTLVQGTQIVVRKDQVKEGDLMIYAANETQLNEKFLSVNNLFEIGCRDKNANAEEVAKIMAEYEPIKLKADAKRNEAKQLKSKTESYTAKAAKANKQIKKKEKILAGLDERVDNAAHEADAYTLSNEIADLKKVAEDYTAKAMACTVPYTNLKQEVADIVKSGEHIVAEAKKHCGFFNKYGRVRCLTLRGEPSFGFLFSLSELQKYNPNVSIEDLVANANQEFDTIDDELFVKVFVPPVKENIRKPKTNKAQKKLKLFNRMIDGEFYFHYDTTQLQKVINYFKPDDFIDVTVKMHGTSVIIGKLHVKEPIKLPFFKRMWNWFIDNTGLFKKYRIQDWEVVYGPVYSSRTVIKNKCINKEVGAGFYDQDIWSEWGNILYPYLENGMTVYGEICGYLTGTSKPIQKTYDYGCEEGQNIFMPYRITSTQGDGTKFEWEISEIKEWTERLIQRMQDNDDDNWSRIHPIDILYHGKFEDLYPNIDTENHWHENVLEAMKNDKGYFGMEENEPMCTHYEVPREGICIRRIKDTVPACYKLKTISFTFGEAIRMDNGEVDAEMEENYGDDNN